MKMKQCDYCGGPTRKSKTLYAHFYSPIYPNATYVGFEAGTWGPHMHYVTICGMFKQPAMQLYNYSHDRIRRLDAGEQ